MTRVRQQRIRRAHPEIFRASKLRMPAEWEPHRATWIAWPHHIEDWPHKFGPVPWVFTEFVRMLHLSEKICILVQNKSHRVSVAKRYLHRAGVDLSRIEFHCCMTDRCWVRDTGPLFVYGDGGQKFATVWKFNAWAKYKNFQHDARVAGRVARMANIPVRCATHQGRAVVLEGGAVDVNGEGLLIATEECLLSLQQARNPHLDRAGLEEIFAEYLGVKKVIWLGRGIAGDDTHGHIDDIARFVSSSRVLVACEDNPKDANHRPLQENLERLVEANLEIIKLPMPSPVFFDGQRLPASYCNFYVGNEVVVVPTFNDAKDRIALGIITDVFPGRRVIGIHAGDLIWGLGALHCIAQQEPL